MPRKKSIQTNNAGCVFCDKNDQHPLLGPVVEKNGLKMHTNCLFAASGLSQTIDEDDSSDDHIIGFSISSIHKEIRRGRSLRCSVCRFHGACVGCTVNTCQTTFHLPCLINAQGMTIFEGNFASFCRRHAPRQDLDNWLAQCKEPPSCCICLFSIIPDKDFEANHVPKTKQKVVSSVASTHTITTVTTTANNTPISGEIKRTRRSSIAPSTPKRITVSTGMSVKKRFSQSDRSTWELASSSSEPEDQNPVEKPEQSHVRRVPLPQSISHIPGWLAEYFLNLAPEKRLPVYEAWKHHTIHGFCCPLAWMHRECIAGFAVSAALHYLKCPYCANRETFIKSIISAGIWVPDQDAAWELEPGAYADLVPVSECSSGANEDSQSTTIVVVLVAVVRLQVIQKVTVNAMGWFKKRN
ncbi:unnamed protein product [Trichobilharzia szidati]|nr:unnamed protein product [Trichobilharzia szidati]